MVSVLDQWASSTFHSPDINVDVLASNQELAYLNSAKRIAPSAKTVCSGHARC